MSNYRNGEESAYQTLRKSWKEGTFGEFLNEWRWIMGYSRRFRKMIIFSMILSLAGTTLGLVSSVAGKYLVDIVTGKKIEKLWLAGVILAFSAVSSMLLTSVTSRLSTKLSLRMTHTIQADVYNAVMDASWQSLNSYSSGDLLNRFHGDVATVAQNAINWLPTAINTLYGFVATFLVIWHYSPVMSLIALSSAPVVMIAYRGIGRKQRDYQLQMMKTTSRMYSFEAESMSNLDTVKSFGVMDSFNRRLRSYLRESAQVSLDHNKFQISTNIFMSLLKHGVALISYAYCLYLLWTDGITYGTMTLFLSRRSSLTNAFHSIVEIIPNFINSTVSSRRIRELMELPRESHGGQDLRPLMNAKGGLSVYLEDVDFAYEEGKPVIFRSTLEAHPGKITALVGPSGEGKTTMLRLLLGIVTPEHGHCQFRTADGVAVPVDADTRRLISYVPQGNTLMSGTVAENLRMVREDATDAEIREALEAACAWDFVSRMPEGIHSSIHERGRGVSEGQAQRLAIARALLRDAPIILLDEATSALDVETERKVLRNILKRTGDRTVILTTHRPTVLTMCDTVYRVVDTRITTLGQREIDQLIRDF